MGEIPESETKPTAAETAALQQDGSAGVPPAGANAQPAALKPAMRTTCSDPSGPPLDRRDILPIAIICAVVVAMFWRIVFTSDKLFFRDIFNFSYPLARFVHDVARQGQLPYWNPYYNWGQHVLGDPNAMFFYPSTLFIVLLPVNFAFAMHFVMHFAWAGVGTYVLARRWGQRRDAALFAALFFALSGPLLSTGNFYNHAAAAAWIPWVLVAADRVLAARTVRSWEVLALVVAVQFLAAEPVTWMASFALALAYVAVGAIHESPLPGNLRQFATRALGWLAGFALAGMAALALAAVQLFPALELLRNSRRSLGISLEEATFWSLHPLQFLEFLVPDYFGSPFPPLTKWKEVLNGVNVPYLVSLYVGFIPVFLALVAWAAGSDRIGASGKRRALFALGSTAALMLVAFGRFTPVFAFLFKVLPVIRLVRYPVKLVVPCAMLIAISAGWGFEALSEPGEEFGARRKWLVRGLAALALVFGAFWLLAWAAPEGVRALGSGLAERVAAGYYERSYWRLSAKELAQCGEYFLESLRLYFPELLALFVGGALWLAGASPGKRWTAPVAMTVAAAGVALLAAFNYGANPTAPREFYDYRPPALGDFAESPMPYRFCFLYRPEESGAVAKGSDKQAVLEEVPLVPGFPESALTAFYERISLRAGTMLENVESVTADEFDAAFPLPYYEFWRFARLAGLRDLGRQDCLLGRANARYLITFWPHESPATRLVAKVYNPPPLPSYLYEDACALPRAFAAGSALYSNDPLFTLARLSDPAFPALDEVILAAPAPTVGGAGPAIAVSPPTVWGLEGKVEMIENSPNRVVLRAELDHAGFVVLLDRYDPNWHASLDGQEVAVLRADHMFRAVGAPAGRHEIRFYYREKWLGTGLAVTLAAALALAVLAAKKGKARF
jgi:membrane protein YfhO